MIVYPAIDVRGGKAVRLREGDPARQTVFYDDPVEAARHWVANGARWLHMVNLDGAFAQANDNARLLQAMTTLGPQVQFGGGLRAPEDIERAFDMGVARVVLGTVAVQQPTVVESALARWGAERICVALDAREGRVTTHGWQQVTDHTPEALGMTFAKMGVQHVLFTDVVRDGGLTGVSLGSTLRLAEQTGLQVIASGGVARLDDVKALAATGKIAGVVIGMALYRGDIRLADALAAAGGSHAG